MFFSPSKSDLLSKKKKKKKKSTSHKATSLIVKQKAKPPLNAEAITAVTVVGVMNH